MESNLTIRPLEAKDMSAYFAFRLAGLEECPTAFGETADHFRRTTIDELVARLSTTMARGGSMVGAFDGDALVGVASLGPYDGEKNRHKAFLWGMYVAPSFRGRGVGSALVRLLLSRAETSEYVEQIHLAVVTVNESAVAMYRRLGFEQYGLEPRALRVDGKDYDEFLMVKMLPPKTR